MDFGHYACRTIEELEAAPEKMRKTGRKPAFFDLKVLPKPHDTGMRHGGM